MKILVNEAQELLKQVNEHGTSIKKNWSALLGNSEFVKSSILKPNQDLFTKIQHAQATAHNEEKVALPFCSPDLAVAIVTLMANVNLAIEEGYAVPALILKAMDAILSSANKNTFTSHERCLKLLKDVQPESKEVKNDHSVISVHVSQFAKSLAEVIELIDKNHKSLFSSCLSNKELALIEKFQEAQERYYHFLERISTADKVRMTFKNSNKTQYYIALAESITFEHLQEWLACVSDLVSPIIDYCTHEKLYTLDKPIVNLIKKFNALRTAVDAHLESENNKLEISTFVREIQHGLLSEKCKVYESNFSAIKNALSAPTPNITVAKQMMQTTEEVLISNYKTLKLLENSTGLFFNGQTSAPAVSQYPQVSNYVTNGHK